MSRNKSRLAASMQKKAVIADAAPAQPDGQDDDGQETTGPSLTLAPPPSPASEAGAEPSSPTDAGDQQPPSTETDASSEQGEEPPPAAEDERAPAVSVAAPAEVEAGAEPAPAPASPARAKEAPARKEPPAQKAQVRAGVGQIDLSPDLVHLRRIMDNGRDQRRYVEDLPRRSDKGTYMRLPVHLQDALAEYCDRNSAPMADFIAAVLDAYFRDIGLLPPLGEGHRPNEKFLDRIRKESRTYDY